LILSFFKALVADFVILTRNPTIKRRHSTTSAILLRYGYLILPSPVKSSWIGYHCLLNESTRMAAGVRITQK